MSFISYASTLIWMLGLANAVRDKSGPAKKCWPRTKSQLVAAASSAPATAWFSIEANITASDWPTTQTSTVESGWGARPSGTASPEPIDPIISQCSDIPDINIPNWDIQCSEAGSSVFDQNSIGYLGDIVVAWSVLGLEDAMLEAVSYAYQEYSGESFPDLR